MTSRPLPRTLRTVRVMMLSSHKFAVMAVVQAHLAIAADGLQASIFGVLAGLSLIAMLLVSDSERSTP